MKEKTPLEYFVELKMKLNVTTQSNLKELYENYLSLLNKYVKTGQVEGAKKLVFHLETVEKEKNLVEMGIDTFVYKDDIDEYIDVVEKNVVKIIELRNYEREIPDEIVGVIEKTKDLFDEMYVVFTDYTGKAEKQVEEKRREKDPILFGSFQDKEKKILSDRFYFLGDWVDEYCDLTLLKMVERMKSSKKINIAHNIKTPEDIAEIKIQINNLDKKEDKFVVKEKKKPFFDKIRTFLKNNKK